MNIATWVIKERKQRLLSQEQLAKAIGVDRVTINYIEKGHRKPTIVTANKLASFFGADPKIVLKMLEN